MLNYDKIPVPDMTNGVKRYIQHGVKPGHFLTALFSNDLVGSLNRADEANTAAMRQWAAFLYWEMPTNAWGSLEKVKAWCKQGGLRREAP